MEGKDESEDEEEARLRPLEAARSNKNCNFTW